METFKVEELIHRICRLMRIVASKIRHLHPLLKEEKLNSPCIYSNDSPLDGPTATCYKKRRARAFQGNRTNFTGILVQLLIKWATNEDSCH